MCSATIICKCFRITDEISKTCNADFMAYSDPSSDMQAFRKLLSECKNLVVLTGAGISAESGVPTFRGAGGYWRRWQAQVL